MSRFSKQCLYLFDSRSKKWRDDDYGLMQLHRELIRLTSDWTISKWKKVRNKKFYRDMDKIQSDSGRKAYTLNAVKKHLGIDESYW